MSAGSLSSRRCSSRSCSSPSRSPSWRCRCTTRNRARTTGLPAAAQIVSQGTAVISGQRGAVTRTMETLIRMRPIHSGFQQAIFSDKDIILENNLNVTGNVGNDGDIYTNGNVVCNNGSVIKGSFLVQGYV